MKFSGRYFLLATMLMAFTGVSLAASPAIGEIQPGKYPTFAINHHTPESYKKVDDYVKSLQKVELELGRAYRFRDLPQLGMKDPYVGYITLGDSGQQFGVIVDIYGEEKRLYIDTDGDGSFKNEPMTLLLNEWQGLQVYYVIGPEPIKMNVKYRSLNRTCPVYINVSGFLNPKAVLVKGKPFLLVQVRTWFLAKVTEDGYEKFFAIVDRNHNGRYDDPEDQLFIDYDNNLFFAGKEAVARKKGVRFKTANGYMTADWGPYPDNLVLGGVK